MFPLRSVLLGFVSLACFPNLSVGSPDADSPAATANGASGGFPIVQYDLANCYVPELSFALYITQAPSVQLPVVISEPVAEFGSVSFMAYEMTQSMGMLHFSGDETTKNYSLTFAAGPGTEFYPGWLGWKGLTYFVLPNQLEVGTIFNVTIGRVQELPLPRGKQTCWYSLICAAIRAFLSPGRDCDFIPRGTNPAQVLTRYRNEILTATVEGQYYIDLYEQHSLDMIRASFAEPDFLSRVFIAEAAWVTALEALVDGTGDGAIVTQAMQDDLNSVLDTFAAHGSPELASLVTTERAALQLDAIAGLTMVQFQDQIETLGGPSAVTGQSWGRIKSLYR